MCSNPTAAFAGPVQWPPRKGGTEKAKVVRLRLKPDEASAPSPTPSLIQVAELPAPYQLFRRTSHFGVVAALVYLPSSSLRTRCAR